MNKYINIETLIYPVYLARIKIDNPNMLIPGSSGDLSSIGYALVIETTKPINDVIVEGEPNLIDGKYYQTWVQRAYNVTELESLRKRKKGQINEDRTRELADKAASVTVNGATFQADASSMAQLNDALTVFSVLGGTPIGFEWRDVEDINHPADLMFLVSIAAERATQVNIIWVNSWDRKATLDAIDLTSETALDEINNT